MKIAINGFGRIGRQALKIALDKGVEVVAINDLTRADELAHLLKFDSVYGTYPHEIKAVVMGQEFVAGSADLLKISDADASSAESTLFVNGKEIKVYGKRNPAELPWGELGVDVVLECTGAFEKNDSAKAHITAGAKKVIISAPSKGDQPAPTYVIGANSFHYQGEDLISNASCTTNCISPVTKIMLDNFGIKKAIMTTIHAYTATQSLVDGVLHDLRRDRAAALNMVPSTTGAAIATTETLPSLRGKFDGGSVRVPVAAGSLSDLVYLTERPTSFEEVNQVFRNAAASDEYRGIIAASDAPLVSTDIVGRAESAIIDLPMTKIVDGDLVKVLAWYDNEWGYSNRLVEMAMKVA
jgi:glyceraldehyde 3-phosphate dehydrogenase